MSKSTVSKSASTNMEDLGIRATATIGTERLEQLPRASFRVTNPDAVSVATIKPHPSPTLTILVSDRPDHPFRAYAQIILRFDDEELAFTPERFLDALFIYRDMIRAAGE